MIGGGRDRKDLESYNPDAFLQSDDPNDMMGCHVGGFAGLNIANPQPGQFYAWADDSRQGLMRARLNGYHVVQADDPEMAAYNTMLEHDDQQDLDSANAGFPGVVLVRRSAKDERRVRAEEQSRRDDLLRSGGAERAFLDGATQQERNSGGHRFMREDNRSYSTSGESPDSPVVESWSPDRGISS